MVAIILVNYNGAKDTIECICSLNELTYKDFQIIVVDNCSTDSSVMELQEAQAQNEFTLLVSSSNDGFSAGNNIGIKYALEHDADYCWLLNNDTLVEPDTLTKLMAVFSNNSRCGMAIGKIYYEKQREIIWYAGGSLNTKTGRTEHWRFNEEDSDAENKNPQKVTFATGCCMCIRRNVIDQVGLMDESYFLYEEDAEYSLRVLKAGFEITYAPSAIIYHKVSASTGQVSPMSQYYTIRNKYNLIRQHFNGMNKLTAYGYSTLQFLFRCCKGELNFKYYASAIKAFLNGEKGKREASL